MLGAHRYGEQWLFVARLPFAADAVLLEHQEPLVRLGDSDLFAWAGARLASQPPLLRWRDAAGNAHEGPDAYSFPPLVDPVDLERFAAGQHHHAWKFLGAHLRTAHGFRGVSFTVWAPDAERVSVVGPSCLWDGRCYPMRTLGASGVWEVFVPGLAASELYKFELRNRATGAIFLKSDPYMREAELRPATASRVVAPTSYQWGDEGVATKPRRAWLVAHANEHLRDPSGVVASWTVE